MEFRGYKAAETAAIKASQSDTNCTFYVNWLEDNYYCIDIEPELDGQPGWRAGKRVYADELSTSH